MQYRGDNDVLTGSGKGAESIDLYAVFKKHMRYHSFQLLESHITRVFLVEMFLQAHHYNLSQFIRVCRQTNNEFA